MRAYDNFFLLKNLRTTESEKIIACFPPPLKFKKGEIIYSDKKFANAIGLILSGTATAVTNNAQKVVMKKFSCGTSFGVAAVFGNDTSYISTVLADSDTEIQFIDEDILKNIFREYPKTVVNYISFLSDKIRFLNEKLSVFTCGTAEDTVYRYLSASADENGYAVLPKSKVTLAKMLGMGRASLYRSLDNLKAEGRIITENNKIRVIENEKNY